MSSRCRPHLPDSCTSARLLMARASGLSPLLAACARPQLRLRGAGARGRARSPAPGLVRRSSRNVRVTALRSGRNVRVTASRKSRNVRVRACARCRARARAQGPPRLVVAAWRNSLTQTHQGGLQPRGELCGPGGRHRGSVLAAMIRGSRRGSRFGFGHRESRASLRKGPKRASF